MTQWMWTGMAIVAVLVMAPVASATSASTIEEMFNEVRPDAFRLDIAPNAAVLTVKFAFSDATASEFRYALDRLEQVGDRDGTVSQHEVSSFHILAAGLINTALPSSVPSSPLTIDGAIPAGVDGGKPITLDFIELAGAEGAVDSTSEIVATIQLSIWFPDVDDSLTSHDVEIKNIFMDFQVYDASQDERLPVKVVIDGYRSWDIVADTIMPAEAVDNYQDGKILLTASDYDLVDKQGDALSFEIRGDPDDLAGGDGRDSPGSGLAVLLGALGVAAYVARRR